MYTSRTIAVAFPRGIHIAWGTFMSLRPWQWTKNLLVFLPLIFSMGDRWQLGQTALFTDLLIRAALTFLILCALSGGVYIINDVFDREQDRLHPRKRRRPIASGLVPVPLAKATSATTISASLIGSWLMWHVATPAGGATLQNQAILAAALTYLALNLTYSSYIKHIALLDVVFLSAGFILRIVAGSIAVDVVTSPWLYTTVGSGALFLVLGKRYSELRASGGNASGQRAVLGKYSEQLLSQLITITATSTLLAYALYSFSASTVPENKAMMFTTPFVVFGLFRFLYILNYTNEGESPELVMLKDLPTVINIVLWAVTAVAVLMLYK
jgi:4-hydroxybenzoate polyprenyltransferase